MKPGSTTDRSRRDPSVAAWKEPGEPPETVVRRDRNEPKTMYSIFFRSTGLVLVHAIQRVETMDSEYYVNNCLQPAFAQVRRERPRSGLIGILLLHDNASLHTAKNTENFLNSQGVRTINPPARTSQTFLRATIGFSTISSEILVTIRPLKA